MFIDLGDPRNPRRLEERTEPPGTCQPEFRSSKRRRRDWACRSINISPLTGWTACFSPRPEFERARATVDLPTGSCSKNKQLPGRNRFENLAKETRTCWSASQITPISLRKGRDQRLSKRNRRNRRNLWMIVLRLIGSDGSI